jgi:hypothetical protein
VVSPSLSLSLKPTPDLKSNPILNPSPDLKSNPILKPSPGFKPITTLNLGLSLHGIRHGRMRLMGLWWVNGLTIHGFVNRNGVLQSNAGAIAAFEDHASINA